jgi:hypothetical protein
LYFHASRIFNDSDAERRFTFDLSPPILFPAKRTSVTLNLLAQLREQCFFAFCFVLDEKERPHRHVSVTSGAGVLCQSAVHRRLQNEGRPSFLDRSTSAFIREIELKQRAHFNETMVRIEIDQHTTT